MELISVPLISATCNSWNNKAKVTTVVPLVVIQYPYINILHIPTWPHMVCPFCIDIRSSFGIQFSDTDPLGLDLISCSY